MYDNTRDKKHTAAERILPAAVCGDMKVSRETWLFFAHTPGIALEPKEEPWKTKEELKFITLANLEDRNLL